MKEMIKMRSDIVYWSCVLFKIF